MKPAWSVGWRNLGRNRRRTLITASGLAMGYVAVVVLAGLSLGLVAEMIDNGTGMLSGQLQVHAPDFLPDRAVYETIGGEEGTDVGALLDTVRSDPRISAATPRVYAGSLFSTGTATVAGLLLGTDPAREDSVTALLSTLVEGRPPAAGERELAVGIEMASELRASVGDTIVLVAPAADGSLGNELFLLSGIFRTGLADLDRVQVVAPIGPVQDLLALSRDRIHEVAARVSDPWAAPAAAAALDVRLQAAGVQAVARSWKTYQPEMVEYAGLMRATQWITLGLVFGMAVFGVANTMLMATFERRKEFAVLLALGCGPGLVVRSVLAEAVALSALSLAAGVAIALPILVWWHAAPPDMGWLYGGFTMGGGFMRPILRVEWPTAIIFAAGASLVLVALLAALWPAVRSGRVPPADALAGR